MKNKRSFWAEFWPSAVGAFCVACWASALLWQKKPFSLFGFLSTAVGLLLAGGLAFVLGFVPASKAKEGKDLFSGVCYVVGGIALNAVLIWYFIFR